MLKYENKGHVIEIKLPKRYGYVRYSVECRYQFDKEKGKYHNRNIFLRNQTTNRIGQNTSQDFKHRVELDPLMNK